MEILMTTIKNKYIGITHPIGPVVEDPTFCEAWKQANCKVGIHAFDEVWALEHHYLHCDVCGMEVHISKVVLPDGKDNMVGDIPKDISPPKYDVVTEGYNPYDKDK